MCSEITGQYRVAQVLLGRIGLGIWLGLIFGCMSPVDDN